MTDRTSSSDASSGPDATAGSEGAAPPPAPWWASPGTGPWGAPSSSAAGPGTSTEVQGSYWPPAPSDPPASGGSDQPGYGTWEQPAYGQPAGDQPAYGEAAYDQPAYGQSAKGQPAYGQPAGDQPGPGQPAYRSPSAPSYGDPAQSAAGAGAQPPYGAPAQPAYGEAAYGTPAYGQAPPPPVLDPDQAAWGGGYPAGSYREPAGANPWAPTDTIGNDAPKGRRGLSVVAAVLATALLAGGVGGVIGARADRDDLLDPSASLGGSSSTTATLDRPPGSVAAVAAEVLKSTVSIAVRSGSGSGTGSGVVIRSDGYVLTNNHVVSSAESGGRITVTVNSTGRELPAEIVGLDPDTDLAVLKVQGAGQLKPAALGQSRDLVVGDPVIAIGSPLGLEGTVTTGIVSALNRSPAVPGENGRRTFLANAIQTDAAINPGNSGGALVNAKGEVIGINSAIATLGGSGSEGGSIGIGFSIPIDEARSIAEEIIRTGRVTHPAIGVEASTVVGEQGREGARISSVGPGSSAEESGLRSGDVIVEVEGTKVASVDELILAIREHKVGDEVKITYQRDGERRTTTATLQDKAN